MSISLVNEAIREIVGGIKAIAIDDGLVRAEDLKSLAQAFAATKKLESVSLENNALDDVAVKKLFEKAAQSITKLSLRGKMQMCVCVPRTAFFIGRPLKF